MENPIPKSPGAPEKNWPMAAHLSALAGILIPLGAVLGPLFVYFLKKNTDPETKEHARVAFNAQLPIQALTLLILLGSVLFFWNNHRRMMAGLKEIAAITADSKIEKEEQAKYEKISAELSELTQSPEKKYRGIGIFVAVSIFALRVISSLLAIGNSIRAFQGKSTWYPPALNVIKD